MGACARNKRSMYIQRHCFLSAVRKYTEMQTFTPLLLKELIERIDVHKIEGTGKNRTQRIVIHYRFVGVIDLPKKDRAEHLKLDTRQGVAVEYITD